MAENKTLAAAQSYHAAGLSMIPIRVDGSKAPDILQWKSFQQTPPTADHLKHWFGNGTPHGIGLVHGAVSGNSEVLDFDQPGLYEQFAEIATNQGYGDLLESLPLVETPSGGRHLLYRCETPVSGNTKLAETPDRKTRIETRGEGGYTLGPGSPLTCHPDGKPYLFLRGRPSTIPTITAEDRAALLNIARLFNEYVDSAKTVDAPRTERTNTERIPEGLRPGDDYKLRPGDDYNARGDYETLLEGAGWRRMGHGGDKGLWQRPGKAGRGLSATSNYGGAGLFYVFSSNAAPFEPQKAYSPFSVYALLQHGGDFAAAARELGRQGYGEKNYGHQQKEGGRQQAGTGQRAGAAEQPDETIPEVSWPEAAPEMFYGLAGDIVNAIEPHTEADPVALLIQFLAAFGSAIGRSAHFAAEADQHFGNLFVVIVGISSKGRKGTSWGHIRRLFALADQPWEAFCVQSGLSSGEGLIWHVRDAVEKPVNDKKTGDVTIETVDPGVTDKRLLIMESEYASVLRVAGRDGNTLSAILRDAWDRGRLQTMTKNNAAKATGAHVSVIGHVTADELRRELSSTEAGNGFANRFLWLCTKRSKELPEGGNLQESALFPLAARLAKAIEAGRHAGLLARDDGARAVWLAVYHDLSEGGPGLAGAVTSRAEAQVMRLALLYALLDQADCIRREHLTAALAVWEYVEDSARYVFGDSMGDPVADDILRALRSAPDGMTRSDLRELFQRHQSSSRIGQALALLAKHGRAKMIMQTDTGGRPAERWTAVKPGETGEKN